MLAIQISQRKEKKYICIEDGREAEGELSEDTSRGKQMPPLIYRRILKLKANIGLQLSE